MAEPDGGREVETFVGCDDEQLAYDIAKYAFKAVGTKGKVIILDGVPGAITAQDRHRGWLRALRDSKGMELLAAQPGNYSRLQSMQVMENLLQRFPEIDIVLAGNDESGLGAVEAIEAAGRLGKIKVTGVDGLQPGIQSILQGRLFASMDFDNFAQGYLAAEAIYRFLKDEKLPQQIMLPVAVIDKSSAAQYNVPPDQRIPPAWEKILAAQRWWMDRRPRKERGPPPTRFGRACVRSRTRTRRRMRSERGWHRKAQ